jgi:biotin carboxyl carrier protein
MAGMTPDPRAIRVRLASATSAPDDRPMRVARAAPALRMTNPSVGRGPLGGAAMAPDAPAEGGVLAQRQVLLDDTPSDAELSSLGGGHYRLVEAGTETRLVMEAATTGAAGIRSREVLVDGFRFLVGAEDERLAVLRERASKGRAGAGVAGPLQVKAIIPGKVVAVSVAAGDAVTAGQQLLVVEAMKMQNELRAPRDGTIERVGVAVGVNIEIGDLLVVIS